MPVTVNGTLLTDHWYAGLLPPFVVVAVKVVSVPEQIVSPLPVETEIVGSTLVVILTFALPLILLVHVVVPFIATAVYVPVPVIAPKSIAPPDPVAVANSHPELLESW